MIPKDLTIRRHFSRIPWLRLGKVVIFVAFIVGMTIGIMNHFCTSTSSIHVVFKTTPLPMQEINFSLAFLTSTKQDLLNSKPPKFLSNFTNPCYYDWKKPALAKPVLRRAGSEQIPVIHCLPYFFLIGQTKCGTTDLFYWITEHPDVVGPKRKEPNFWQLHRHDPKISTLEFYASFFNATAIVESALHASPLRPQKITGEGSVLTLTDHHWWWLYPINKVDEEPRLLNAQYIRYFMPNVKLIVALRDPVERLYSDYLYSITTTRSPKAFDTLVKIAIDSFHGCLAKHSFRSCIYNSKYRKKTPGVSLIYGVYVFFIKEWMKVFPRKQFLFIQLEIYSTHRKLTMDKIFRFLDLRRDVEIGIEAQSIKNKRNEASNRLGDMLESTRQILRKFYQPYNEQLADLLGEDILLWKYNDTV